MAQLVQWLPAASLYYSAGQAHEWIENIRSLQNGTCKTPQLTVLRADVRENGITNPLLIDSERMVLIGNQRLCVARSLDIDLVPCITVENSKAYEMKLKTYKTTLYDETDF